MGPCPTADGTGRNAWMLLAALLASYPLSAVLAPGLAREHGVLENLQVLVLGAGCVLAIAEYLRTRPARIAMLALWAAPVWLLLAGRELSWGKAWLRQPGLDGAVVGPAWLTSLVWPGAAALLAWLVFSAWYYRIDVLVRAAFVRRAAWLCLGVALAAAMGSTCAEGHMSCSLPLAAGRAQLLEELVELLAYLALGMLQARIFRHHAASVRAAPVTFPVTSAVEEVG